MSETENDSPTDDPRAAESEPADLQERVIAVLRTVFDPEIPVNIYDLGLVYGVEVDEDSAAVHVTMTLTSPMCPVAPAIVAEVEQKVRGLEEVEKGEVELTWEPAWDPTKMSDAARLELGF